MTVDERRIEGLFTEPAQEQPVCISFFYQQAHAACVRSKAQVLLTIDQSLP